MKTDSTDRRHSAGLIIFSVGMPFFLKSSSFIPIHCTDHFTLTVFPFADRHNREGFHDKRDIHYPVFFYSTMRIISLIATPRDVTARRSSQ
jgi:hypothetical protein